MKYYIDTEFIEGFHKPFLGKKRHFIDLISIAIVSEDGREYYSVSSEYNYKDADQWVKENVIDKIYLQETDLEEKHILSKNDFHRVIGTRNTDIAREIIEFIGNDPNPVFYAYYADYDWVLFCSLFGRMIDLPKGFPMYCIDLKQELDRKLNEKTQFEEVFIPDGEKLSLKKNLEIIKQNSRYPENPSEHCALDDARWNQKLHKFINTL